MQLAVRVVTAGEFRCACGKRVQQNCLAGPIVSDIYQGPRREERERDKYATRSQSHNPLRAVLSVGQRKLARVSNLWIRSVYEGIHEHSGSAGDEGGTQRTGGGFGMRRNGANGVEMADPLVSWVARTIRLCSPCPSLTRRQPSYAGNRRSKVPTKQFWRASTSFVVVEVSRNSGGSYAFREGEGGGRRANYEVAAEVGVDRFKVVVKCNCLVAFCGTRGWQDLSKAESKFRKAEAKIVERDAARSQRKLSPDYLPMPLWEAILVSHPRPSAAGVAYSSRKRANSV